ncbi:hypothetical protein ACM66B_000084 [Microbotryomycetes sp. NB124-2]
MSQTRFAQVGGHDATVKLMSDDSSIVNKPATKSELDWYTSIAPKLAGGLVGQWTPHFYGKLTLQGRVEQESQPIQASAGNAGDDPTPEMVVLENLTYRFNKPNVLDVKLGTQLYDEHASEDKKQRMTKAAQDTTSAETGVRLTGFQVWDADAQQYHTTPKALGKLLKVDQLHDGFLHFFDPPSSPFPPSLSTASNNPQALPKKQYVLVMKAILKRLEEMVQLLQGLEIRVRGSSLLIVIEGDPATLQSTMDRLSSDDVKPSSSTSKLADDEDDEESDIEDEHGNVKPSALIPFDIKWIDFAHARLAPGEGPDEGLILGVQTTRDHLRRIIERLDKP